MSKLPMVNVGVPISFRKLMETKESYNEARFGVRTLERGVRVGRNPPPPPPRVYDRMVSFMCTYMRCFHPNKKVGWAHWRGGNVHRLNPMGVNPEDILLAAGLRKIPKLLVGMACEFASFCVIFLLMWWDLITGGRITHRPYTWMTAERIW